MRNQEATASGASPGQRSGGLARVIASRLGPWLALLCLIAALGAIAALGQATRTALATDSLPIGSSSAEAEKLRASLPESDTASAIVVYSAQRAFSAETLQQLQQRSLPGSTSPLIPSEDGTAAIAAVELPNGSATEVGERVAELREQARADLPEGVTAQVTGPAAIQADLAAVFEGADLRLLIATASVVAVLLVITYRSPVLWIIPLLVVGVADRLAAVLATHAMAAFDVVWDESTVGILSVLVFGAGTDYALLLISRYRDELRRHENRNEAMAVAVRNTAEAVLSSATTVVLGLLTLLLSLQPSTRGLGLACAIGVVIAAVFALVVLPGALVAFGRWIFWPRIPHVGDTTAAGARSLWRRVGDGVSARPAVVTVIAMVALAVPVLGASRVQLGLSDADQFLRTPESIVAAERLSESFPAGTANPIVVVTKADPAEVAERLAGVQGVASARPGASGNGVSEISVVTQAAGGEAAEAELERIRQVVADDPDTFVTGSLAQAADVGAAASRDRGLLLPLILGLVVVALMLLLRCVLAPILLVVTVVITYLASLGLSWQIFGLFGFERLDDKAPLLAFVFLVALGVDYNIFLVTRAREEAREHGTRHGMLRALAATGGVITSAGVLLAAVFAVLGVLPLVVLAQLGVIVCVGVLLDTLLVRTVLVPALAFMLGDRFWWPSRRGLAAPGPHRPREEVSV